MAQQKKRAQRGRQGQTVESFLSYLADLRRRQDAVYGTISKDVYCSWPPPVRKQFFDVVELFHKRANACVNSLCLDEDVGYDVSRYAAQLRRVATGLKRILDWRQTVLDKKPLAGR